MRQVKQLVAWLRGGRRDGGRAADAARPPEPPSRQLIIFLSAVSDEFRGYRARLRDDLMRAAEVGAVIQEDFDAVGEGTLEGLDARIRNSAAVVHLIGDMAGGCPRPLAVERLLDRCPNLPAQLGLSRKALIARDSVISYTQWEAYLAIFHDKKLYIAEAARDATREPATYRRDAAQLASQQAHRDRLRKLMDRWHELQFEGPDDIARKLLPALAGQHREAFTGASVWSIGASQFEDYYLKGRTLDGKTVPAPFGGRQREFDHLDRWLGDPEREPRLLVSAPAGRGKSALLAKWMEALKKSKRAGPEGWRLVFVPISNRFQTNRATVYLELLTRQLAQVAGEHVIPPAIDPEPFYRSAASRLIANLAAAATPTLLVFDGLDEALGEEHLANLLPAVLPPTVKVLASARWIAGDSDGGGWLTRLGWIGMDGLADHDLVVEPLDSAAIADVLVEMGAPIAAVGRERALVGRLAALTEGEPLLLRFYAEDLWLKTSDKSPITVDVLDTMQPGFGPFFKAWLQDQGGVAAEIGAQIDPRTTDATLAILGFAKGALTGNDLLAIGAAGFPQLPWRLMANPHVAPFRRFVIGDGSDAFPYIFNHPKVADYIRTEECDALADQIAAAFFAWGRGHIAKLNSGELRPEKASRYAIDHYAGHLMMVADTAATEDYMAMVEDGWRRAKDRHDSGPAGFVTDVRAAWTACRKDGPVAHLGAQWRCALVLSSIISLGRNIPGAIIVEAVRRGILPAAQARYYAELKGPTEGDRLREEESTVRILAKVAAAQADYPTASIETGNAALRLAMSANSDERRARFLLEAIEEFFSSSGRLREDVRDALASAAWDTARLIEAPHQRVGVLIALAKNANHSMQEYVVQEARALAEAIEPNDGRAGMLTDLLPLIGDSSRPALAMQALQTALVVDREDMRSDTLAALAPYLNADQLAVALQAATEAATEIDDKVHRSSALLALAPHLDAAQKTQAIAAALQAALEIEYEAPRSRALAALAPLLDAGQHVEALQAAVAIEDEGARHVALLALLPHVDAGQRMRTLSDELQVIKAIDYEYRRSKALAAIAPHLDATQLADALQTAKSMNDQIPRTQALSALAPRVQVAQKKKLLADVLHDVKAIGDEVACCDLITALAPHLDAEQLTEALQIAKVIGRDDLRCRALAGLATHLDAVQKSQALVDALEAGTAIDSDSNRFHALAALAPQLDAGQLAVALRATMEIGDQHDCARVLVALAPHLDAAEKSRALAGALQAAKAISYEGTRISVLVAMLPHLDAGQKSQALADALQAAKALDNEYARAKALIELAPHLNAGQLADAVQIAKSIIGVDDRVRALGALTPRLDAEQITDALRTAKTDDNEYIRSAVLVALAPHLGEGQLADAMQIAVALPRFGKPQLEALVALGPHLGDEQKKKVLANLLQEVKFGNAEEVVRSQVLLALVPHLDGGQVSDAVQVAVAIRDEVIRARLLVALAPHLNGSEKQQALSDALLAVGRDARAQDLATLAPYLDPGQIAGALQAVATIQYEGGRSGALSALAPHLAAGQLAAALQVAMAIHSEGARSGALAALAGRVSQADGPVLMNALLDDVSNIARSEALEAAAQAVSLTEKLGRQRATAELRRAISDVCRWYP